jgi:hypothetical protein
MNSRIPEARFVPVYVYLGCKQRNRSTVNDRIGIELHAPFDCTRAGELSNFAVAVFKG